MRTFFKKVTKFILSHKIIAVLVLVALSYSGYWGYKKWTDTSGQPIYLLAQIKRGTITASVSGSGQVSVSNQVDLKAKASGDVVYVGVQNGDAVSAGELILQLDARDAQKSVRDAEVNLESAKLALEKLKGPEGAATPRNKQNAEDDLKKAHDDGFTAVSNAFLDLPAAMTGLKDLLFGINFSGGQSNMNYYADAVKNYDMKALDYRDAANSAYQKAKIAYDKNFDDYRMTGRESGAAATEALIDKTYATAVNISDAVKAANNLIQFYRDQLIGRDLKPLALSDTHLSAINTYTDKTNTHIAALLNIRNQIKNGKDAISDADLDISSQELSVKQRENALQDAKEKLSDYFVRAPSDGIAAKINFKKGDAVSSGAVAATFITRQRLAEISLNEVDVAKIKTGQKSTLTFDAIPDLSISGEVAEIDTIGTVAQGVVSYMVKITFDTQDERVKPGMSVSAAIITDVKTDALTAPVSAVKSQGQEQYVEVKNSDATPERVSVQTGIASDEFIEIISGVKEGDNVVSGTISAQMSTTQTQQQSGGFRIPGVPGQGGSRPR